ncbi:uncharacterized protein LOC132729741 [Ruditapes philippinarum]|uniref:uncharacterized protein LOC132729741 n=1 Tax=Ruditapes philippinarum TaxID=129788 RepID=UPI00295AFEB5|nr:uncharacterized protein LOC132729741 [Ruditapes philippinarum]
MVKCLGRWGKHDFKQGSGETELVTNDPAIVDGQKCQTRIMNEEDEEEVEDLQICCLSGCLTTIAVAILFFLALPTGVLLCVYATANDDPEVLAVGIVLAVSPVISLPLIIIILYNRRRIRRLRKRKVATSPEHPDANRTRY